MAVTESSFEGLTERCAGCKHIPGVTPGPQLPICRICSRNLNATAGRLDLYETRRRLLDLPLDDEINVGIYLRARAAGLKLIDTVIESEQVMFALGGRSYMVLTDGERKLNLVVDR